MGKNSQTERKGGYRGGVVGDRTNPNPDKKATDNKKSNSNKQKEVQNDQPADAKKVNDNEDFDTPSDSEREQLDMFTNFGSGGFLRWIKDNSLLASLDEKTINERNDDGKYKYSLRLRNAYSTFAKKRKQASEFGEGVASLGRAIGDGYGSGWGMR